MGRLAWVGTGVFGLFLNDDHDAIMLDGVADSLLRATVTAQVDNPLGLSPTACSRRKHWLSTMMPLCGRII